MKTYDNMTQSPADKSNHAFVVAIENHLQQLCRLHKKAIQGKPMFLLLGPSRAGKTTFLRHAELTLNLVVTPDDPFIQTWICDNATFIDIQTRAVNSTDLFSCWENVAKIIHETRGRQALQGILLILPLHDLMNQAKLQRDVLINDYKKIANTFAEHSSTKIPMYTIFTQTDRLSGFPEYFDDLEREQRQQVCGMLLSATHDEKQGQFFHFYDQLLKNIHTKLIKRLQQVHNVTERARINDFALHLESIKTMLADIIGHWTSPDLLLENRGCFFVSNLQDELTEDRISKVIEQTFALPLPSTNNLVYNGQAYFSHQLVTKLIPHDYNQFAPLSTRQSYLYQFGGHFAVIGLSSFLILAISLTGIHEMRMIPRIEHALSDYQIHKPLLPSKLNPDDLTQLLATLDRIQRVHHMIMRSKHRWLDLFPYSRFHAICDSAEQTYVNELKESLYPYLMRTVHESILALGNDNPEALYAALKAYLMLAQPENRQSDYLATWFQLYWQQDEQFKEINIQKLIAELTPMLESNAVSMPTNDETIRDARAYLKGLAPADLGLMMLKSDSINSSSNPVPFLYTKDGFLAVMTNQLNDVAKEVMQGNWVIGSNNQVANTDTKTLTNDIRDLFAKDYARWWQQYLVTVSLPVITDLDSARQALNQIAHHQSQLITVIEQMRLQTSKMNGSDDASVLFNRQIAEQFSANNTNSGNQLAELNDLFKQFSDDLNNVAHSPDQNRAAFELARNSFQPHSHAALAKLVQESESLPPPFNLWVMQLVDGCWQAVLPLAKNHLAALWEKQIATTYAKELTGKYPIALDTKNDLPLTVFNQFFAPDGTFAQFTQENLSPFINTDSPTWSTKRLGAIEFPLSQPLLETLVRAKLIKQMFFPDNSHSTRIGFNLTPMHLDPIIKDVVMDIDGQALVAANGTNKSTHLTWPGAHSSGEIHLIFNNIDGSKSFIVESGPWSWFRLLSKVDIRRQNSPQQFEVTFNLNGNAAHYQLTADTILNPYLANIVAGFELPKVLFAENETV